MHSRGYCRSLFADEIANASVISGEFLRPVDFEGKKKSKFLDKNF